MSQSKPQSLTSHSRFDPPFHFFLAPILIVNFIMTIVHLVRHFNLLSGWLVILALSAVLFLLQMRRYSIQVQDRVIRLEEKVRLAKLAPAEWHPRIDQLSIDQLIGLRFAGDGEVVALAQQALNENLKRKQIKQRIRDWRPDHWRV